MRSSRKLVAPALGRIRAQFNNRLSPPHIRPTISSLSLPRRLRRVNLRFATSDFSTKSALRSQSPPDDRDSAVKTLIESPASTWSSPNGLVPCIYFDNAQNVGLHHRQLTKDKIAEQFELRHRDLRDVDLRSEAVTRILVRPATIVLHFFDLLMVIQADEALLIDLRETLNDERSGLYKDFGRRISGHKEAVTVPELPYELRAVEATLIAVISTLHHDLAKVRREAEDKVQQLNLEPSLAVAGLDLLFEYSRRLGKIEQKARLVRDVIREVLDTDEDLAGMYLSDRLAGKPHETWDHQEAEYMFEAYYIAADGLVESAHDTVGVIQKREGSFRSALAVQRNQIMFLEARIAIHTLSIASGTLIAGLFGMNLVNYFEEAQYGFVAATGFSVILSSLFSMYGMRSIRRMQTLKEIQGLGRWEEAAWDTKN